MIIHVVYLVASANMRAPALVIAIEVPTRFLRLPKQFIDLFVELYILVPGFCCYTDMSLNSYPALSQQLTHYFAEYPLNLFSPQFTRCHNLLLAVGRVPHEDWVVRFALVDQSFLEGLDYILAEVLLGTKNSPF